jgi:hypothetical protein
MKARRLKRRAFILGNNIDVDPTFKWFPPFRFQFSPLTARCAVEPAAARCKSSSLA